MLIADLTRKASCVVNGTSIPSNELGFSRKWVVWGGGFCFCWFVCQSKSQVMSKGSDRFEGHWMETPQRLLSCQVLWREMVNTKEFPKGTSRRKMVMWGHFLLDINKSQRWEDRTEWWRCYKFLSVHRASAGAITDPLPGRQTIANWANLNIIFWFLSPHGAWRELHLSREREDWAQSQEPAQLLAQIYYLIQTVASNKSIPKNIYIICSSVFRAELMCHKL